MKLALATLTAIGFAAPTTAQLMHQATGELNTSHWDGNSSGSQSLPPGTDVTNGASVASGGASATCSFSSTATEFLATFQLNTTPERVGSGARADADLDVTLTLTSAVSVPVSVAIQIPSTLGPDACRLRSGSVDAGSHGQWNSDSDCPFVPPIGFPSTCSFSFDASIGPSGLTFDVEAVAAAVYSPFSPCVTGSSSGSFVTITVTPRSFGALSYGTPCSGPSLAVETSFAGPPTVTAAAPNHILGVMLIGNAIDDTPLDQLVPFPWPCPLRTSILVSVPVPIDPPSYQFAFEFLPPAGFITLQLIASDGVTVNTSNGLSFSH